MPSMTGNVYDLDYIQNANWCQVLINPGLVGFVRTVGLQSVLETAMQLNAPVTVEHDNDQPTRIRRVVLRGNPPSAPPPNGLHYVLELDVDEQDGKCKATLIDSNNAPIKVFTRDARMQSLLATALRESWRVGYLSFDPASGEISRGKLNASDQRQ